MTELIKYEAARRAIAEAVAVDEVAELRSKAEALRHYARQAGDRDLELQAAQIRFRAERRMGELLIAAKQAGQVRAGRPENPSDSEAFSAGEISRVTLREAGIDHKLSSRAQKVAAMDAAEFEQALERHAEEMRSGVGRIAMDLMKIRAEERGRKHRRDLAQALSDQSAALPIGRRYPCVYLDPPWSRQGGIGDRAYENHYPTMTWPQILDYLRQAGACLLPDAWAFMWIPRAHLLVEVEFEREVMVKATGEMVVASEPLPLAYACQLALGMDAYSTCFVWTKTDAEHPDHAGTGLLVRDQDELLLLFKRGAGLPKPEASAKFGSNHRERPREHSRKPDFYRHMIATMVGSDSEGRPLPVLELFARVDAEHPLPPGWDAAGNQANSPDKAIEEGGGFPVAAAPQNAEETGAHEVSDIASETAAPIANPGAADLPELNGSLTFHVKQDGTESTGAACFLGDATAAAEQRASHAAAVEISEYDALKALSDFCHPRRAEIAAAVGEEYQARGLAIKQSVSGEFILRESGKARLRELEAARVVPVAPVSSIEISRRPPSTRPQLALDLVVPANPEIVDGCVQTRLPVNETELEELEALRAIAAGAEADGQMVHHLVGKGWAHCTTKRAFLTEEGEAALASFVDLPAVEHGQGAT